MVTPNPLCRYTHRVACARQVFSLYVHSGCHVLHTGGVRSARGVAVLTVGFDIHFRVGFYNFRDLSLVRDK
jgi:hypothetical protein